MPDTSRNQQHPKNKEAHLVTEGDTGKNCEIHNVKPLPRLGNCLATLHLYQRGTLTHKRERNQKTPGAGEVTRLNRNLMISVNSPLFNPAILLYPARFFHKDELQFAAPLLDRFAFLRAAVLGPVASHQPSVRPYCSLQSLVYSRQPWATTSSNMFHHMATSYSNIPRSKSGLLRRSSWRVGLWPWLLLHCLSWPWNAKSNTIPNIFLVVSGCPSCGNVW